MKKSERVATFSTQYFLALILVCVCFNVQADTQYFVQMKLNAQESGLEITTHKFDAGCSGFGKKKGCITAHKGDKNLKFSFLLAGKTKCTRPDGDHWKLSQVSLGGKGSSSKPNTWGGFASDTEVTHDFDFSDPVTGVLNPAGPSNDRQITISDKNDYAYEVWYKVEAICVDVKDAPVGSPINADPRIINEG